VGPSRRQRAYETARLGLARMRVAGASSLRDLFSETTRLAAETVGVERVGIWLYVAQRRAIRCFHLYERSKDQHSEGAVLRAADFPGYFASLEEQREIPAERANEDPRTRELRDAYLGPLGIESMLDAPIFRGGEVVGVVCHEHVGAPRPWSADDRAFAASVADQVARAFEEAERHDAEARVRDWESHAVEGHKMEALGRLAAGVAHDFNNLLTVILSSAHEIATDAAATPAHQAAARRVIESARRGAALARDLLSFGRDEPCTPRVIDVSEALRRMESLLSTAAGKLHPVAMRCPRPAGRVMIDAGQLERVMMNLVLNAREAMPRGGAIEVSCSEAHIESSDGKPAAVYVVIEVADHGVGMDAQTRERMFEPFFTTKKQGSGIGLSVVYGVIERAGGFLHVDSEPGNGTRVRIYLPRVASP
jgi:signal transduction histidine kinase